MKSANYDKVSSIDEAYTQTMIFLARTFPHLYFLSKYLRVTYDENGDYIARTDGKSIKLTSQWLSLSYRERLAVFMHVLYHVFLKHPLRINFILKAGISREIASIACDAKVNHALLLSLADAMSSPALYKNILLTYGVPEEMLEKASVEEIAKWLQKENPAVSFPTAGIDVQPVQLGESEGEGGDGSTESFENKPTASLSSERVLNEGKESLIDANLGDFEKELDKAIRTSLISAKTAGARLSAIEERILDSLTKSKVNWRSMLRNWITSYIKTNVVQSYIRPNRRLNELPGQLAISKPNAWVFVDVSGSIGSEEFRQFMSEVLRLSSFVSKINLIVWDTRVTGEYELSSKNKGAMLKLKFRGGGGTRFSPVLQKYLNKIKFDDLFICLTDGYWFDVKQAVELLKKVRAFKILVTTDRDVDGFDKRVKIGVGEEY